ncbi:MAG: aldo/keto reductase [Pseudomonadota bacterium]|nr:aldo/keto reductase [Pseudomonadota bacterium]
MNTHSLSRRRILTLAAAGLSFPLGGLPLAAAPRPIAMRPIPSTGEAIPVLGMGTWITFNVGSSSRLRDERVKVLQAFFDHGGRMVDSSPMYGSAEDVMGYCLKRVRDPSPLFSATKIWTSSDAEGVVQMQASERLWGESQFDLQQVHNLLNWEFHLARLKEWKVSDRIRYLGITTSHGRRHSDFADVMQAEPLDFVQLTYNILDREMEDRLLPLAADRGQAVIVNRPFQRGGLFQSFGHRPLPEWAREFGASNWAQFFLKFVLSHPAVTCAIPATSQVGHMEGNMAMARGPMPDAAMRRRMIDYVERL